MGAYAAALRARVRRDHLRLRRGRGRDGGHVRGTAGAVTSGGAAPILYFLHIFKTGGTTFRSLLRSNYQPEHLFTGPILARVGEDGRARTPDCPDADVREVVGQIRAAQGTLRAAAASLAYGIHRHLERPVK